MALLEDIGKRKNIFPCSLDGLYCGRVGGFIANCNGDVGAQSMVKGSREPHCEAEPAGGAFHEPHWSMLSCQPELSKQRQQHGCVEGLPGLS